MQRFCHEVIGTRSCSTGMLLHRLPATAAAAASISRITFQYNIRASWQPALSIGCPPQFETVSKARSTSCTVAGEPWIAEGPISSAAKYYHSFTNVAAVWPTPVSASYAHCWWMPSSASGMAPSRAGWPYNRSMPQIDLRICVHASSGCRCSSTLPGPDSNSKSSKEKASNGDDEAFQRKLNKLKDFILDLKYHQQQLPKEQTFAAGDVLGHGRYQLLSKQAHQHAGSAKLERESWDVMWSARDLKTNKDVTIKVTESGTAAVHQAAVRTAALHALAGHHPNILRILDSFEQRTPKGRHVCVVMEKPGDDCDKVLSEFGGRAVHPGHESRNVSDRLEASGICMMSSKDGVKAVKAICRQLFTVLDHLHSHGIVYMNITPDQLLLDMPFEHQKTLGAKALEKASDTFSLQGFNSFVKMYMSNKLLEKQAVRAAATVTDVYNEENLHKATIKLANFRQAKLYSPLVAASPDDDPLSDNICRDRDGRVIKTRDEYRAPEELLGYKDYATPAYDIWRAGQTIFEIATGRYLLTRAFWDGMRENSGPRLNTFDDDHLHLFDMIDTLGSLPREFIRPAPLFKKFYMDNDQLQISRVFQVKPGQYDVSRILQWKTLFGMEESLVEQFHGFITSVLVLHPAERPTAAKVLRHPWLQE